MSSADDGSGLRVLLTNNTLGQRGGSELYLRDVALGLLRRGHRPVAYSTQLGDVAEDLRRATVPVVDELQRLGEAPDIIHGQHHLETMAALLRFPGVPAVYFCHGFLSWISEPPRFPRVARYVAPSWAVRDRLISEHGIPPDQTLVIHNAVDLRIFRERDRPLPSRPRRAVAYGNRASDETFVAPLREACRSRRIELDALGKAAGKVVRNPEDVLPGYDIVFASGRCAVEALAVGAAVILCDVGGSGPLVTSANCEELRRLNFALRALRHPVYAEEIAEQIDRFDARDAARVTRWVRREADVERALDQLETLYREALRTHSSRSDPAAELAAASAYLERISREYKQGQEIRLELQQARALIRQLRAAAPAR
jgi:glycosyltransferase involved in cell wall biosynthesis